MKLSTDPAHTVQLCMLNGILRHLINGVDLHSKVLDCLSIEVGHEAIH